MLQEKFYLLCLVGLLWTGQHLELVITLKLELVTRLKLVFVIIAVIRSLLGRVVTGLSPLSLL